MKYYSIAGIATAIDESTKFGRALCDYFRTEETAETPAQADFVIRVTDRPEDAKINASYTAVSGKFRVNRTEFSVRERYYTYAVKNLFADGGPTELTIAWTRKSSPKNALRDRATAKTIGLSSEEARFLESALNYTMFWTIFALVLLKKGKVFVHAGIFTVNGRAHVAAGSAGCGKTSTLLGVLESKENGYIDEDFGVLGSDGAAWYVPKRVTVYEEDAAFGSGIIERALSTLTGAEKRAWNFYRAAGANMRYKFRPEVIFPGQVVKRAPIEEIDFVVKSQTAAPVRHEVSAETMAEKLVCASFREMKMLYELLNNIRAVGSEEILRSYPPVRELEDQYREILLGILNGCERFCVVETPFQVKPPATIACLLAETAT